MLPNRTQSSGHASPDVPIGEYVSRGAAQGGPSSGYGVREHAEHHYLDSPSGAWAPKLVQQPGGTPDPHRTMQQAQRDYRPTPLTQAPERWWQGQGPGREVQNRHTSTEYVDADGWQPTRPVGGMPKRAAPDPRRTPPEEPRLTNQMAPSRYIFTRPFDQHSARAFNGIHFSMADHRRTYPIMGMQPTHRARNTYRLTPAPWDTDIGDVPPNQEPDVVPARIQQVELPTQTSRAWRL